MELQTPRLALRLITEEDIPFLFELEQDPRVYRFERDRPRTLEQVREKFAGYMAGAVKTPPQRMCFLAARREDGKPIGRVTLRLTWDEIGQWEIGWYFMPECWGRGYATEAARAAQRHALDALGAHRVMAYCHAENKASEGVMRKLGMTREGYHRGTLRRGDSWQDELFYAYVEGDPLPEPERD